MGAKFIASTVCYLFSEDKVLFIKFNKKWGQRYAPPGGKVDENETPLNCIIREFKEETSLELLNPKLKGISHWFDSEEGFLFVFTCDEYIGNINNDCNEGKLEWIPINKINGLEQFEMNKIFTKYLFENGIFEGDFTLDEDTNVISYSIEKM